MILSFFVFFILNYICRIDKIILFLVKRSRALRSIDTQVWGIPICMHMENWRLGGVCVRGLKRGRGKCIFTGTGKEVGIE